MSATVTARGLTRSFDGRPAVAGLDLEVGAGEVLALLGPNGAGKTTTVRLLNGVLAPDSGSSTVLGLDPATDGERVRARTGVLTETAGLDDRLTALENVLAHARIRGLEPGPSRSRALGLLEQFGVAHRAHDRVQGFSTGQRKRVALARSLVHDPEVLFLDEPTSGLDPESTREVADVISGLAREHGRAIILCTHFLAEAGRLCDRMAVLREGRLVAQGRPADLAASIWSDLRVEIDLGGPASDSTASLAASGPEVVAAEASPTGLVVTVSSRDAIPGVIAALVSTGLKLYGVEARPPTLEDVYFALTRDSER
jgi:ABC-2 type transport system ATP-binding protein